jgi:Xaa-Pro aminopeptidase
MYTYFDTDFFTGNRQKLRKLCDQDAPIVIAANGLMQKSADVAYPFRQESNFWYLCGVDEPSALLIIDNDETYIIMPDMSEYQQHFDGQKAVGLIERTSGITDVYAEKEGWQKLAKRAKQAGAVYSLTPPPAFIEVYGIHTNPTRQLLVDRLLAIDKDIDVLDAREHLAHLRMVKQPPELQALQAAIDLTVGAFKHCKQGSYETEKELETALTMFFLQHGQTPHGYDPIVASGKQACVLHYHDNDQSLKPGELILIDSGAEIDGYSADISRTYPFTKPTTRQHAVHAAVVAVQDYAFSLQKPGPSIRENEKLIEAFMGDQLVSLGLIKKPSREAVRRYYPHSTSHFLGRDVHDLGDYDQPLVENMVLTVEPGIYIPEENIGVRIEDDVLITKDGHKVLSLQLPRDL